MKYQVNAEWDTTGWWVVTVPAVPGAITQTKRLEQVPADAAEVIEIQTGKAVDPADIDVRPHLPGVTDAEAEEVRRLRAEAEALAELAIEKTTHLVVELGKQGFPLRDIGVLAGISHQRAQQIVKASEGVELLGDQRRQRVAS